MKHLIGETLTNRYQIEQPLGEGGMGIVFKAHDLRLDRTVAIKVMHPHLANQPSFQQRFAQEAKTAARLDDPGVVKVHDSGRWAEYSYIVMEYIPGNNLRQMLDDLKSTHQWISLPEALRLVHALCQIVDYMHEQGILYRDLKPENVMLKARPSAMLPYRPVLTDLGLVRLLDQANLTQIGVSMGTPHYMSPEQARGDETDARSDVYSLGVLLYELTTGQIPFPAKTLSEAIRYHTQKAPPAPIALNPSLGEPAVRVILKALEKNPNNRFQTVAEMSFAIDAIIGTLPEPQALSAPSGKTTTLAEPLAQQLTKEENVLLVVSPLGQTKTVPIQKLRLNIGSSVDNDLVLAGPAVQAYHAQILFDGMKFIVSDLGSTEGTYLGGTRLLKGVEEAWSTEQALRIGEYHLLLQRKGVNSEKPVELSEPSPLIDDPIGIRIDSTNLTNIEVAPGSMVSIPITVINLSPIIQQVQVTVEGVPSAWVVLPKLLRLHDDAQTQATMTIQPPRSPQSGAGAYSLLIRAFVQNDPAHFVQTERTLTVAAYYAFAAALHPQKVSSARCAIFSVQLQNNGNADLTLHLTATDPEAQCNYQFASSSVTVAAGQMVSTPLTVQPQKPSHRMKQIVHPFVLSVQPSDAELVPQQLHGEWLALPWYRSRKWLWLLLIFLGGIVLMLVLTSVFKQFIILEKGSFATRLLWTVPLFVWIIGFVWWRRGYTQ